MTPRDYLASLEFHGIKLGLDNIRLLMEAAGNPQSAYPSLHVAGTNGKGSVVAFAESILRAAGHRTGRFTSPHLFDVSERFLIEGHPISNPDLDRHIGYFRGVAKRMANPPTYFELCTAVALRYFAEQEVDAAVIEVGMGGRFDSTNIIDPAVCAITNIAMDHTNYLGNTIGAIAFEKAGIVKQGVPVVVGEYLPAAFDVIQSVARERSAPVLLAGKDFTCAASGQTLADTDTNFPANRSRGPLEGKLRARLAYRGRRFRVEDVPLGLAGAYQIDNAAVAIAMLESIPGRFSISDTMIVNGLASARWPCRLECVLNDPPVYIDVAHNPAGARRLAENMPAAIVIISVSSDKNAGEMLQALRPISQRTILTEFSGSRAMPVGKLAEVAGSAHCEVCSTLESAIELGIAAASREIPLLITGSIFTAAQARRILMDNYNAAPPRF